MSACRSVHPTALVRSAWSSLARVRPPLARVVLGIVLPLSLLPPLLLYYAGTQHGDDFMPGFAARDWRPLALAFLVAEWATVAAMGPLVRWVARQHRVAADLASAYLLAFAAPIPLWLSALALLVPNFAFAAGVAIAAFILSCLIIYQGVVVLLRVAEPVVAAAIAYGVMACGLLAWGLLLVATIPLG